MVVLSGIALLILVLIVVQVLGGSSEDNRSSTNSQLALRASNSSYQKPIDHSRKFPDELLEELSMNVQIADPNGMLRHQNSHRWNEAAFAQIADPNGVLYRYGVLRHQNNHGWNETAFAQIADPNGVLRRQNSHGWNETAFAHHVSPGDLQNKGDRPCVPLYSKNDRSALGLSPSEVHTIRQIRLAATLLPVVDHFSTIESVPASIPTFFNGATYTKKHSIQIGDVCVSSEHSMEVNGLLDKLPNLLKRW